MVAAAIQAPRMSSKTESFVDDKRKDDICQSNIIATRVVAYVVRTSLGHKGMDKMIQTASASFGIILDKLCQNNGTSGDSFGGPSPQDEQKHKQLNCGFGFEYTFSP
ncbi:hypothetical protein Ancab_007782 [Ancistrocladus abbreviatus]